MKNTYNYLFELKVNKTFLAASHSWDLRIGWFWIAVIVVVLTNLIQAID